MRVALRHQPFGVFSGEVLFVSTLLSLFVSFTMLSEIFKSDSSPA